MEEPDFAGYATKAGLKCSDGRTITPDAFRHQHAERVPLVWQHGHNDPENVLGHAILESRDDGVYTYAFFNNSPRAQHAKASVQHGDITQLSIWANKLIERTGQVLHGVIREVSLVLSGANPGALIDPLTIRHADGEMADLEDEAIIYTGLQIAHSSEGDDDDDVVDLDEGENLKDDNLEDKVTDTDTETDTNTEIEHADGGPTIQDIYDSMTEDQKTVLHFMVGEAVSAKEADSASLAQSNVTYNIIQEGSGMGHNVFEPNDDAEVSSKHVISHSDMEGITADARRCGSLKTAVENYALQHGIENIGDMFPEARAIPGAPDTLGRRTEWVDKFMMATKKNPFARIKSLWADITEDEARARGYIKGTLKKEEFFRVAKRVTTPTTVYKKQKLDRDDIVDITDLDIVAWLRAEMRVMLDEEVARAALIGDGRAVDHPDKINDENIRPIAEDHELYTTTVNVNIDDASSSIQEVVDAIVLNRRHYRGTGMPMFFTSETYIAKFLLLKDGMGRRLYRNLDEVASELRVSEIVPVEVLEDYDDIVGIMVNPADYNFGTDRGGEVNLFDDFDIDYNQNKYLIETRLSGALVKLKSAIVVKKVASNLVLVAPTAPSFDSEAGEVTINNTTGVVYKNGAGTTITNAGSPYSVASGDTYVVDATPATGYYFATSADDHWEFTAD